MPQTVLDIVSRSAWNIDDELYSIIKPNELIKSLDRVYREYCRRTQVLSGIIRFLTVSTSQYYDLYGPITDSTDTFGDEILKLWRVEYNGKRAEEKHIESILNLAILGNLSREDSIVRYGIKHVGKYMRMYFPFVPGDGDTVDLGWYKIPRVGTLTSMSSTFEIDDKYVDDLILGLDIYAWRTLAIRQSKVEQNLIAKTSTGDDSPRIFSLARASFEQMKSAKAEWEDKLLKVSREVAAYKEEITPVVVEIGTPMTTELDGEMEIDEAEL